MRGGGEVGGGKGAVTSVKLSQAIRGQRRDLLVEGKNGTGKEKNGASRGLYRTL